MGLGGGKGMEGGRVDVEGRGGGEREGGREGGYRALHSIAARVVAHHTPYDHHPPQKLMHSSMVNTEHIGHSLNVLYTVSPNRRIKINT